MVPPKPPASTDHEDEENTSADSATSDSTGGSARKLPNTNSTKTPLLEDLDQMTAEQLADYFYALAEEIISSPQEYKLKMGLEQLDIGDFDNIDLSTPAGRKKLAALFRLLAVQVLSKNKEAYLSTVVDKSKPQGKTR